MRIAINTLPVTSERGGIQTYLLELLRSLLAMEHGHELLLVTGGLNQELFEGFADPPRVVLHDMPLRMDRKLARVRCEQFRLPKLLAAWRADVLFGPVDVASLRAPCPQVVTAHHATWSVFPEMIPMAKRLYLRWILPRSLRVAARVLAVSRTLRDHLVGGGWADPERVDIVPLGVRRLSLFEQAAPLDLLGKIGSGYYLFVGDLYPYKGVGMLLEAMRLLQGNFGIDRDLVVVGNDPWGHRRELERRAVELGISARVRFVGPVPHGRLGWLYERAFCLLHPSRLEAFPLPAAEAMACGTPVVASTHASFQELVGDAGILVDPERPGELVWALRRLEEPSVRSRFVRDGLARSAGFDWDRTAEATLACLERAAGLPATPMRPAEDLVPAPVTRI